MSQQEFKAQVIASKAQWISGGLAYGLRILEDGGLSTYPVPAFSRWLPPGPVDPLALSVDECGLIYYVSRVGEGIGIFCYDPVTCINRRLTGVRHARHGPFKIRVVRSTIWVLADKKIMAFSNGNLQLITIIRGGDPIDFAVDDKGRVWALDKEPPGIRRYADHGKSPECPGGLRLESPVGLAAGGDSSVYVLDDKKSHFIKIDKNDRLLEVGDFSGILNGMAPEAAFIPTGIGADSRGCLYVSAKIQSRDGGEQYGIYCFDADGSYLGKIAGPDTDGEIKGFALDSGDNVYAIFKDGIAFYGAGEAVAAEKGYYYTRTLDCGADGGQWHRLRLDVDMAPGTLLEVYCDASDDRSLAEEYDKKLFDKDTSTQYKAGWIEDNVNIRWGEPDAWGEGKRTSADMLFRNAGGRYLRLKLRLSTYDVETSSGPSIKRMKVTYPRASYLRYLPAIYQEDPASKDLLERFLSIFESVLSDLEGEVGGIDAYFDPDLAPAGFLGWLGSWLSLAVEEGWPEQKKRYFVRRAYQIFKTKGTRASLEELIRIYTGKEPVIVEPSRLGPPMVLGGKGAFILGDRMMLIDTPVPGLWPGVNSIPGKAVLLDTAVPPASPAARAAYRFIVLLDLTREEFARLEKGLRRILDDEKPAHTEYTLGMIADTGPVPRVGMSSRVQGYVPMRIGEEGAVGHTALVTGGKAGLEQGTRLDGEFELI